MTRWFILAFVAIFALCAVTGHVLSRIDRARSTADLAAADVRLHRAELIYDREALRVVALETERLHAGIALCRRRTQNLRDVMDVLIQSGVGWPERVRLPRIAGWAEWPAIRGEGAEDAR